MLTTQQISKIKSEIDLSDSRLPAVFNALGDPTRFKIFKILSKQKDICVSEVADILNVSVPAISQQLKILENSNLLIKERKGQTICYKINGNNLFVKLIVKFLKRSNN